MSDADPAPEPPRKPVPLADWMAVWAEEDAREEARKRSGEVPDEDTQLLTPEQVFGKADDDEGQPVVMLRGDGPTTPRPPSDNFDAALDGEIRRLLERTAHYVKRRDVAEPETAASLPGEVKAPLDFETPPGSWEASAPPLQFDDASAYADETGGRLGLLDPVARPWHDPPTPHTIAPKHRTSNPPLAPFEPPSMTAPLQESRRKPSGILLPQPDVKVAPIPWTEPPPPPPHRAAGERSTTRRMRDTARRVAKSIAVAASEPAAPWLSLAIIGIAAAWIAVAFAAGNPLFALVGLGLLAPLAIAAAASAAQRGAR